MTSTTSSTSTGSRSSGSAELLKELAAAQNEAVAGLKSLTSAVEAREAATKTLTDRVAGLEERINALNERPRSGTELSPTQLDAMTEAVKSVIEAGIADLNPLLNSTAVGKHLVANLGDEVSQRAVQHADEVAAALDRATDRLDRVGDRAARLNDSLAVAGLTKLALAAIPYAVVIALLLFLVVPAAEVTGIGPLSRWVWGGFETADGWPMRAAIASGWFAALGVLGFGVYKAGHALARIYRK